MAVTNLPNGLTVLGMPVMGSGGVIPPTSGTYFFVDSVTGSNGNDGLTVLTPFATLVYALTQATASKYDVIILLPTHAETIATAGGVTMSKIGVSVIGMGQGSLRPTFSFSAVGSTWAISAAACTVSNIRVTSTVDEMVKMFHVTAAYVTLDSIEHFETTSCQTIQFLLTTAAADYLTVSNCYFSQATAAASAQLWLQLVGNDNVRIVNNEFFLTLRNAATSACITSTTATSNALIANNKIVQLGGTTQVSAILMVAASSGFAVNNWVAAGVTTLAGTIALASMYGANNYAAHTVNKAAILDPVVDS